MEEQRWGDGMTMKAATKTVWMLILAAFLIGLGLVGIGLAFGGNVPVSFGPSGMRFQSLKDGRVYDARMQAFADRESLTGVATEPITDMTLHMVSGDIRIKPTDASEVSWEVRTNDPSRYQVTQRQGELRIEFRETVIFGIGFFDSGGTNDEIIVLVPQGMELQDLSLRNVSGTINIVDDLLVRTLDITSVSGDIVLEGLSLADPAGTDLSISSVSSNIHVQLANLAALNLEMVSGTAEVTAFYLDDFTISSNTVSGQVSKDDSSIVAGMGTTTTGSGSKRMQIDLVSGTVELNNATLSR